jgi:hypothetical protein
MSGKPLVLALLAAAACRQGTSAPYPDVGPIQSFEGESVPGGFGYGVVGDSTASNNQAMEFYSTVTVTYPLEVIREASGIVVRAKGDDCHGPPKLIVGVDGRQVLETEVKSRRWTDYPATVPLKLGMHTFTFTFPNDEYEPPSCDRNLYVDKVTLVNARPPNTGDLDAEALLSPSGSAILADPLASHGHALGLLSSGAALGQTTLAQPAGEVIVRARGDDCKGPPLLVLSIDGEERLSTPVASSSWHEYPVQVDLPAGMHNVSLEFPNDHYEPPSCDRNLYIDTVRFLPRTATAAP